MNRTSTLPFLLALTLAVAVACAPAGPEQTGAPAQEPTAQVTTEPVAESTAAPDAEPAEATIVITAAEGVTGVQDLDWNADAENCLLPGAVITGSVAGLPPCEPSPESEEEAAANQEEEQEAERMPQEPASQEPAPEESAQPQGEDAGAARVTALAVEDLAQNLGVPPGDIEVREVRAVTWPDASMGCAQPDMMYAQMLQEGYLIRLSAGGEDYYYHSGGDQPPFLCEDTLQLMPPDPRAQDEFVPPPGFDLDKKD